MTDLSSFITGFLSASLTCFGLALLYYLRARARVRQIEAAIRRYQEANQAVSESVNRVFARKP